MAALPGGDTLGGSPLLVLVDDRRVIAAQCDGEFCSHGIASSRQQLKGDGQLRDQ